MHNEEQNINFKKAIIMCIVLVLLSIITIMASEADIYCVNPIDTQYFELKAVEIATVNGQKQVMMELWGHEIDFKRI